MSTLSTKSSNRDSNKPNRGDNVGNNTTTIQRPPEATPVEQWQPPAPQQKTPVKTEITVQPGKPEGSQEQHIINKENTPTTLKPLTRKQEAFVKHLVDNPKSSATQAALATYGKEGKPTTIGTAQQIAHDNLSKPNIVQELQKYMSKAEYNLMILADKTTEYALLGGKDGASYAGVAERVNNSILDRLVGKAVQRQEVTTKAVTLNIDLTGSTSNG
jgi:hypothetical protein